MCGFRKFVYGFGDVFDNFVKLMSLNFYREGCLYIGFFIFFLIYEWYCIVNILVYVFCSFEKGIFYYYINKFNCVYIRMIWFFFKF